MRKLFNMMFWVVLLLIVGALPIQH